jgi:hypothetical protein
MIDNLEYARDFVLDPKLITKKDYVTALTELKNTHNYQIFLKFLLCIVQLKIFSEPLNAVLSENEDYHHLVEDLGKGVPDSQSRIVLLIASAQKSIDPKDIRNVDTLLSKVRINDEIIFDVYIRLVRCEFNANIEDLAPIILKNASEKIKQDILEDACDNLGISYDNIGIKKLMSIVKKVNDTESHILSSFAISALGYKRILDYINHSDRRQLDIIKRLLVHSILSPEKILFDKNSSTKARSLLLEIISTL